MKLVRLKITDTKGFRSLQPGFEHHFRTAWELETESQEAQGFAPFVCAGPNGSGKSNLLEALVAIFFQLEVLRGRRILPETFLFDEATNPKGFQDGDGIPNGFELEYLIQVPDEFCSSASPDFAHVKIVKKLDQSPNISWINQEYFEFDELGEISERERDFFAAAVCAGLLLR